MGEKEREVLQRQAFFAMFILRVNLESGKGLDCGKA